MENLNKRPSKGILRFSEGCSRSNSVEKDIKWDEANIKETLHPDDKEYGFMQIDEPPTPFSRSPHGHSGENSDEEEDLQGKTDELLERVSRKIKEPPVTIENVEGLLDDDESDELVDQEGYNVNGADPLAPSASTSSKSSESDFETKRKRHYNEFHAVKLAKKLMQKELDNDDEDEDDDNNGENVGEGEEGAASKNAADRSKKRGDEGQDGGSKGDGADVNNVQGDDTFDKDTMIS